MAHFLDIHSQQTEILDRIVNAHERLRARLLRVTRILNEAHLPYAVMGGNAVAVWVATRDESFARATGDADILVRASDLDRIKSVLEWDGFSCRHSAGMDMFLHRPEDKAGDAVHLIFAGTFVQPDHVSPAPMVPDPGVDWSFSMLPLEDLERPNSSPGAVRIKFTIGSHRSQTVIDKLIQRRATIRTA
jgi:hypothetical protein